MLIFGLLWQERNAGGVGKAGKRQEAAARRRTSAPEKRERTVCPAALLALLLSLLFLCGNLWTCAEEIKKAPAREAHYEAMAAAALQLDQYSDEELESLFEYHHGGDRIRAALGILEQQHWNIYQ